MHVSDDEFRHGLTGGDSLSRTITAVNVAPCPFCGYEEQNWMLSAFQSSITRFYARIECIECEACGPSAKGAGFHGDEDDALPVALEAWNARSYRCE